MTAPTFIPNLFDRYGNQVFLPEGAEIPEGIHQVTDEVYQKIMTGAPRVYENAAGQTTVVSSATVWLPTYQPPEGWTEITDPERIDAIVHPQY